jgi:hypothetical protein
MPEITLNSFPTNNSEELKYALPQNMHPYSTLTSTDTPQGEVKMRFRIERTAPVDEPVFGTHVREAVDIVKDWVHKR